MLLLACSRSGDAARAAVVVADGAACRKKAIEIVSEAGTCLEKRARVEILYATDRDCLDIFEDAGSSGLVCKDAGHDH